LSRTLCVRDYDVAFAIRRILLMPSIKASFFRRDQLLNCASRCAAMDRFSASSQYTNLTGRLYRV